VARYDAIADWYEHEFMVLSLSTAPRETALRLLDSGPGRLLDVGCGTGIHSVAFANAGWSAVGVDLSKEMLRHARARDLEVIEADAAALPFDDGAFDAAASIFTHTDVDDFAAVLGEVARVLRPNGAFVYVGAHPCFVGPHSRFVEAQGVPTLHRGYRRVGRYEAAPGVSPKGLRAKVGAVHLPLGLFLQAFLDAGFTLEHFEEPEDREYPFMVALRARK
jgi:ubiquinone/menaquinone biosynthesis C-methylase UbiE